MKSDASTVRPLAAVEWLTTVSTMCAIAHKSSPALAQSHTGRSLEGNRRARQIHVAPARMGTAAVRNRDGATGLGRRASNKIACRQTTVAIPYAIAFRVAFVPLKAQR